MYSLSNRRVIVSPPTAAGGRHICLGQLNMRTFKFKLFTATIFFACVHQNAMATLTGLVQIQDGGGLGQRSTLRGSGQFIDVLESKGSNPSPWTQASYDVSLSPLYNGAMHVGFHNVARAVTGYEYNAGQVSANAASTANWRDNLVVYPSDPGLIGTQGTITFTYTMNGFYSGDVGSQGYFDVVGWSSGTQFQNSFGFDSKGFPVAEYVPINTLMTFQEPFTFGTPFDAGVYLQLNVNNGAAGIGGSQTTNLTIQQFYLSNISAALGTLNPPSSNPTILDNSSYQVVISSTDPTTNGVPIGVGDPLPEPGGLAVLAVGGFWSVRRRRRHEIGICGTQVSAGRKARRRVSQRGIIPSATTVNPFKCFREAALFQMEVAMKRQWRIIGFLSMVAVLLCGQTATPQKVTVVSPTTTSPDSHGPHLS